MLSIRGRPMNDITATRVLINGVKVDFERNVANGRDGEIRIESKLALLLKALIERADAVVSRDDLIESVW